MLNRFVMLLYGISLEQSVNIQSSGLKRVACKAWCVAAIQFNSTTENPNLHKREGDDFASVVIYRTPRNPQI